MRTLLTCFILLFAGFAVAKPLNQIVVFGDSLSDNGNLYEHMHKKLPQSPPYYEGRFTNGPVWVERLTEAYFPGAIKEHLSDYAFGGAGVSEDPEDDTLFTLKKEIDTYFLAHNDKADENSLFIIWIGANNYLGIPDDTEEALNQVKEGISHGLKRLADAGAKHILIVNMPDLGKTPIASAFDSEEILTSITQKHNQYLEASIKSLREAYPEVQWLYYDVNGIVNDLISSPEQFGFNNIKDTCYEIMVDKPSSKTVLRMAAQISPKEGSDVCQGYLFFDPVHPTGPAHQIMADRARSFLDAEGVEFSS
ncbi:GDSL family lysophospholipase PlaA [Legionella jordanis]|uniref:Lysophospholipase A n=1 Tax=Legionella jordanis TaxID=456 RepID=A0A0W0V907_9GAMM|nr:SGNH/GDSL hydrolase family protein [Legionella jordanis]KTD16586.1 lysophospholipase A [Legionella jordanis]RMX03875.1 lysophospholipase [Legionella jordanis]VEH11950.1 lysophospholipase A [Legionella jordanis]HAT8712746.1 lysophospholipase [Legionella jordanis]